MALTKTPRELAAMSQDQRDMYRKALCWNMLKEAMDSGRVYFPDDVEFIRELEDDAIVKMTPRGSIVNTEA